MIRTPARPSSPASLPAAESAPTLLTVLAMALLALLVGAPPAGAHAGLVDSDPADGSTVTELGPEVVLTFSEEVSAPVTVIVTDPAGTGLQDGDAVVDGAEVRQAVDPAAEAGLHTLAYRVVSADGHPITGQVRFTVDPGPAAEPTAEPTATDPVDPDAAVDAAEENDDDPSALAIWGTAAVLAVVLVVGFLAYLRRKPR